MTAAAQTIPVATLLAMLGLARASALLLAQGTGVVDWSECAGWCVRAGERLVRDGGAEVARGQASGVETHELVRHVVETLSTVRAYLDCTEVENAQRAADWALGGAR
jgi:hypothetical protein